MGFSFILLLCALSFTSAQYNPYPMWSMGNQMWNMGMRFPGQMYGGMMSPGMWRSSSLYAPTMRMSSGSSMSGSTVSEKSTPVQAHSQGIFNVPKVPGSEEVLTHMALATQNIMPYTDTISDFLYSQEPLKSRQAVLIPAYLQAMSQMRSNAANQMDDCHPITTHTSYFRSSFEMPAARWTTRNV